MFGQVVTVGIQCTNLEASKQFYRETLGLQQVAGGTGWAVLSGGTVSISLWQGATPDVVIGFGGADLAEVKAELGAKGVDVGDLQPHPGGRHYNVFDPDGHRVMLGD